MEKQIRDLEVGIHEDVDSDDPKLELNSRRGGKSRNQSCLFFSSRK